MHNVILYEDSGGVSPVAVYLAELDASGTKDARIRRTKIRAYVKILRERGLPLPENICKHMVDKIYELRPVGNRVFFAAWVDDTFVLLHCYKNKDRRRLPGN